MGQAGSQQPAGGNNNPGKDGDKKKDKKWEPPAGPTRVGKKKRRGPDPSNKLPAGLTAVSG